jgi:glycosyltransferase involved in cell wall biosynthesis
MNILVITQFFPPDITAAAFRLGDTATLLARKGHDVKVLAGDPHKGSADGVKMEDLVDSSVDVRRCSIKSLDKKGMRSYIGHYMSFVRSSISAGMTLKKEGWKPDVILCSSPPLFVGLAGRYLSFRFRRPLVFEVRDIWPDSAVAAEQLSSTGIAYRVGRMLEKYLYKKADHIACVAEPMAEYIRLQCPESCPKPVTVVYNGIQASLVPPASDPPAAPDGIKTLLYAGNFGHVQNMDLIVEGFIEASKENRIRGWRLRLIGTGVKLDELKRIVGDHGAESLVRIDPPVPRDVVFREMQSADALYLSLQKSFVLEHTIPSKVFDYLAMSRPIVAALSGEGREILSSTGANLCIDPGDSGGLQTILQSLGEQIDTMQVKASANRDLVLERFTREIAVDELIDIFERAIA